MAIMESLVNSLLARCDADTGERCKAEAAAEEPLFVVDLIKTEEEEQQAAGETVANAGG